MLRWFPCPLPRVAAVLLATSLFCAVARADEPAGVSASPERRTPGAWSVEVDPLPFVAGGYSVAAGWQTAHVRLSANAFAANLPSFSVQDGWTGRVRAAGALRLQLYPTPATGASSGPCSSDRSRPASPRPQERSPTRTSSW